MPRIMGGAQLVGGAVATYFGAPEVGVPLMANGAQSLASGKSTGGSGLTSGLKGSQTPQQPPAPPAPPMRPMASAPAPAPAPQKPVVQSVPSAGGQSNPAIQQYLQMLKSQGGVAA